MISQGNLVADGVPHAVIAEYMATDVSSRTSSCDLSEHPNRRGGMQPAMRRVTLLAENGTPVSSVRMGASLSVQVDFHCPEHPARPNLEVAIKNTFGVTVFNASNRVITKYQFEQSVRQGSITCSLPDLPLVAGLYTIDLFFGEEYQNLDAIYDAISFDVTPADVFGSGQIPSANEGTIFWPAPPGA